ncbi:MAG: ABC transporter ATP-binding protein [Anaerolineales bacterium]
MKDIGDLLSFVKPYWKKSLLALTLLTLVVISDLAIPRLVQRVIDQGILKGDIQMVIHTFFLMLAISITNMIFAIGNNNLSVQVGESVARDLREALFLKIQSFSYGNLDRLQTGQLLVRLSSDTAVFQRLVQISLRIGTRAPLLMIGSLIFMFNTDRNLALAMMPLLLLTLVIIVFYVSRTSPLYMTVQKKLDKLNTLLQENIAGVRLVRAFVRRDFESQRFEVQNEEFTERNIKVMQFMATMSPLLNAMVNIGIVAIIWGGGWQAIQGRVSTGQLAAFINYLQTTLSPLMIMGNLANVYAAAAASAQRIQEILTTQPEIQDVPDAMPVPELGNPQIEFEHVAFHYNNNYETPVLRDVNLEIHGGQKIGILGSTGAGKTTLLNLIPRFYDVTNGKLKFNSADVRQLQQDSILEQIAIVPQETVLFSGTVRDNIRYGRPQASEEEVIAAAKAAQAHEFILSLPQGYDTHIEERGVNLSGGQKQRIAIARALLMRPTILLLDDCTSAVDLETESKIQAELETWMQGKMVLFVGQRISSVMNADQIIVMDQGRIAAIGKHQQLLATSPIYQEIYASQMGNGGKEGV